MIRRDTRYDLAKFGWGVLSVGGAIVLYSGAAAPTVTPSQLPGRPFHGLAGGVAVALLGMLVVATRETAAWKAAGRRANLAPDGGGLYWKPDLVGSVHGRPVRARTKKHPVATGSSESGSSRRTFTVVEAELDRDADEGLIVTPASGARTSRTSASYEILPENADVTDDELAAVGGPEAVAREVISGRSRTALLALDDLDLLYVGDAAGALTDVTPDVSDSRIASWVKDKATDRVPGDAATVSVETKGVLLDADRLREQAEAVAAAADAFEEARGGR